MSVPKQKQSKSRSAKRRSHNALAKKSLNSCDKCKKPVMSHKACEFCGTYRGKQILKVK